MSSCWAGATPSAASCRVRSRLIRAASRSASGRRQLRLGRGEVRLGLVDLFAQLLLLVAQGGLRLHDLRRDPLDVVHGIRALRAEFVGRDDGNDLPALHDVALLHAKVVDAAANLRADDEVVGGHHAGEDERVRLAIQVEVGAGTERGQQEERKDSLHSMR